MLIRSNTQSWQADRLVGWWSAKFAYGGSNLFENVFGNHGAIVDGSWVRTETMRTAWSTGANEYAHVGDPAELQLTDVITLAAWVRCTADPDLGSGGRIISKTNGTTGDHWCLSLTEVTSQIDYRLDFRINNSFATAPTPVPLQEWTHFAGVYTGSKRYYYIDGKEVLNNNLSGAMTGTGDVRIAEHASGTSRDFGGQIFDVRVYHKALSASEVYQLYAPQTRFELYKKPSRVWANVLAAVYPLPSAIHAYRQRRL